MGERSPKPSSSKSSLCPTYEFIFLLVKSKSYYYTHTLVPLILIRRKAGDLNVIKQLFEFRDLYTIVLKVLRTL